MRRLDGERMGEQQRPVPGWRYMTLSQLGSWAFLFVISLSISVIVTRNATTSMVAAETRARAQTAAPTLAEWLHPSPPPPALVVPVAQVAATALSDTWGHARSERRSHEGIDIMAPLGTPVLAAANGRLVKFFDSVPGGVTIYQFDTTERFVYYYAHLGARAANVAEGDVVRQGDVIGFVGQTGNAPVPHLHFEIQRLTEAKHWWEADSLNPYPYLVAGQPPR